MRFLILVGKTVAVLSVLIFCSMGWRLFRVGLVPTGYGLRPDWAYFLKAVLSFALAAGIIYFVFIR